MSEDLELKPKKKGVRYFTQDTEDAIVEYNTTTDSEVKNQIYHSRIHYAFYKLTENIIHTFKFYYTEVDSIEDLQYEIIIFLLSKIHLFDATNGAKAYSYFGTITKRWLILYNQKNYKKRVDNVDLDIIEEDENHSYEYEGEESPYVERLSLYIDKFVEHCTENIFVLFPKTEDAQIADAVLELFRKRDKLDIFNKSIIHLYT